MDRIWNVPQLRRMPPGSVMRGTLQALVEIRSDVYGQNFLVMDGRLTTWESMLPSEFPMDVLYRPATESTPDNGDDSRLLLLDERRKFREMLAARSTISVSALTSILSVIAPPEGKQSDGGPAMWVIEMLTALGFRMIDDIPLPLTQKVRDAAFVAGWDQYVREHEEDLAPDANEQYEASWNATFGKKD